MNAITAARLGRGATIRLRLAITFSVLILLLAGTAAIGAWRLAQLSAITDDLATVHLRMERLVGEWLSHTRSNAVRATVLTHSEDPELHRLLTPAMEATTRRISGLQKELEGSRDLVGDWVGKKCGNWNTKTNKCGGQGS